MLRKLLPALILIPLLSVMPRINMSWEAVAKDDTEEMSCPESCEDSLENCRMSCSQIVGGGVASEKRKQCSDACDKGLTDCNRGCINPTPRPTMKPGPYHDKPCTGICEYKNKDCAQACTKYTGGAAASVKKSACLKDCGDKLDKCNYMCVNPETAPTFSPGVYENNPCAGPCGEKRKECEGTCGMFTDQGEGAGKRGECLQGCRDVEHNCLDSCAR
jgi:hypothetical protein